MLNGEEMAMYEETGGRLWKRQWISKWPYISQKVIVCSSKLLIYISIILTYLLIMIKNLIILAFFIKI